MLKKPNGCAGCPFEKQPDYLCPTSVDSPKLVILSDYPTEKQCDEADVWGGESGHYLKHNLVPQAGVTPEEVQVEYAIKCRVPYGYEKKKGGKAGIEQAVSQCRQYLKIQRSAEAVVCHGDIAATYYGGVPSTEKFRGFLGNWKVQEKPTYIVKSTAEIMKAMRMIIPTKSDWRKLRAYREGQWPKEVPHREIAWGGVSAWMEEDIYQTLHDAKLCVVDTEYDTKDDTIYPGILEMIGVLLWDGKNITGYQFPWKSYSVQQKEHAGDVLKDIFLSTPTVMHNLMADVPVLEPHLKMGYSDYHQIHDTMLLHALLYAEWPHDLGFLESLYSPYDKMKHLSGTDPFLYNWGDCLSTFSAWQVLEAEAKKDGFAWDIYNTQSLPLSVPRLEARKRGVRLDKGFLASWFKEMSIRKEYARQVAVAWCGYEINPGSDQQVTAQLIHEGFALKKNRKTGAISIDKDVVAGLRRQFIDFDPEKEKDGITPEMLEGYLEEGGHGLLEARKAYQVAADIKSDFLVPLLKEEYQKDGRNLLEVSEDWFVDRVFPTQHIHTQASGRWSTVSPALPLLPPKLRGMLIPDEGWVFLKFDWSHIELRISAALADDKPSVEAFANGWDTHTLNACDVFSMEYPPNKSDPHHSDECKEWREKYGWEGTNDKRRVFAKGFVYRLRYRGDARYATDIPGAKAMGLNGPAMVNAARGYLRNHPSLQPYWNRMDGAVLKTRTVRSIYGRKRYLNGPGKAPRAGMVPEICREGSNHPMQSSVSDIFNKTIVDVYQRGSTPYLLGWVYGAHDSQVWQCPEEHAVAAVSCIQGIATQVREINGYKVVLPVEFDPIKYAPEHTKEVIHGG